MTSKVSEILMGEIPYQSQ